MVILLPEAGKFKVFESLLDVGQVEAVIESLQYREVALTMPKFKVESDFSLADSLSAMGMPAAFSASSADFSGMDGTRDLYIGDVIQKAVVSVDEAGTEAAAVTIVVMRGKSAGSGPVYMRIDRPFIFLIRDIATGTILFLGRIVDP